MAALCALASLSGHWEGGLIQVAKNIFLTDFLVVH